MFNGDITSKSHTAIYVNDMCGDDRVYKNTTSGIINTTESVCNENEEIFLCQKTTHREKDFFSRLFSGIMPEHRHKKTVDRPHETDELSSCISRRNALLLTGGGLIAVASLAYYFSQLHTAQNNIDEVSPLPLPEAWQADETTSNTTTVSGIKFNRFNFGIG